MSKRKSGFSMTLTYESITELSREDAELIFETGTKEEIAKALVNVVHSDGNPVWLEELCMGFSQHSDPEIRGLAATCFGHIARLHGKLNRTAVEKRLNELLNDKAVAGRAEDALDDIEMFLG